MSERWDAEDDFRRYPAEPAHSNQSQQPDHQHAALSPSAVPFPASTSPSARSASSSPTVFSSFIARGAKFFNKSGPAQKQSSAGQPPVSGSPPQATASRPRQRNVSGPSNLRLVQTPNDGGSIYSQANHLGARSVVDLGAGRRSNSETPPVPTRADLGDLRRVANKAWAHSADDLGAIISESGANEDMKSPSKAEGGPDRGGRLRKPSLNLRIEAYRNNVPQNPAIPSPSTGRDFPSPGISQGSASPVQTRFVPPSQERAKGPSIAASDSSPVLGASASNLSTIHNRSSSFNALGSTPTTPRTDSSTPRHKATSSGNVPNFSFPFASKSAPPARSKPPEASNVENRRASQFVHHSGFINRNVGTSFPLNLSKNWKAYKAEIKGSKLYFFKPPSEKASAVKELFPTEHGGEIAEEIENTEPITEASEQQQDSRRRRLFWGPGRHPEMTLDSNNAVVLGSTEALTYEMVFAATFHPEDVAGWQQFSSIVLLSLPTLAECDKFEAGLLAVADRYLRYAEGEVLLQQRRRRIEFLIDTYCKYQYARQPSLTIQTLISSFSLDIDQRRPSENVFQLPPFTQPRSLATRPSPIPQRPSFSRDADSSSVINFAQLRKQESMSRERTMTIDAATLFQSLQLFFLKVSIESAYQNYAQSVQHAQESAGAWPFHSSSRTRPHWLTHFIVEQIIAPSDKSVSVSATHTRSLVISKWIQVADQAKLIGNECMWGAITDALVSKPIARLEKVWRRVDTAERLRMEGWAKNEDPPARPAINQIPLLSFTAKNLSKVVRDLKGAGSSFSFIQMQRVHSIISSVHSVLQTCTTRDLIVETADVFELFHLWEILAVKNLASKPLDEYIAASFNAEPVQVGRLSNWFQQPRSQNYPLHALVPFTFPEPLPSLAFLDRGELVRLRKESLDKLGNSTSHDLQMEHLSRLKFFPSEHVRAHWTSKEGIELDDTIFRLFGGEMIVKVVKETQTSSRPASFFDNGQTSLSRRPSRAPSIRVKPQAASALERKSSSARRQSMPLLSNSRQRIASAENIVSSMVDNAVPVVIVGGTIERLVDVLIRGLDYVMAATSDDNGEMALSDRRARGLKLDRDEYSKTWWSTYRSFLSSEAFIAMIRKQYRTTLLSLKLMQASQASSFSNDTEENLNLRLAILAVLSEWMVDGGGVADMLAQPALYNEVNSWLHNPTEHANPVKNAIGADTREEEEIERVRTTLVSLLDTQTKRPPIRHISAFDPGTYEASTRSYGPHPPDLDRLTPKELVEQLDAFGSVGIRELLAEDLISCTEIMEIQSKDKTGWILLADLPTLSQDEMIVQNIYFHIDLVEPSPLLSDFPPTQRLYQLAQTSVRTMLYCFQQCRIWATAVLAQPGISFETRVRRMEVFIRALEMVRILSSATDGVPSGSPVVRSFVETVLTTAILSPESRMFHRAWCSIAAQRGVATPDTLEAFLKPTLPDPLPFSPRFKLAVDFGWIIERLLELMSMPDTLIQSGDALGTVVNFEKRRHLHTFILNTPTLATPRPSKQRTQLHNIDMARLDNMHVWANKILQDGNGNAGVSQRIKDEAFRENSWAPSGSAPRKYPRPFQKIVLLQQEKNKRDRHIRERLVREKRLEQQKKEKQGVPYEKAMEAAKKSKAGKRASLNPFMRVVRPLSTAFPFGAQNTNLDGAETRKWTLEELKTIPSVKPSFSIDLAGARVEEKFTNVRPFVFTLETEDGVKYYLQATTRREIASWITHLSKTSKSTSEKRRTYIGPSNALPDLYKAAKNLGRHPTAIFAVPLPFLIEREFGMEDIAAVPTFLELCLEEVETRGFSEDGIYRVPGSKLQIDRLKAEANAGKQIQFHHEDIHNICSLIKLWIREIPDGLMAGECFGLSVEAVQQGDRAKTIALMRQAVEKLPSAHFHVLRRIMEHLTVASTHEDQTRMAEKQFSLVFGQTVLTPPDKGGLGAINAGIQYGNRVVEVMLIHYHAIFEGEAEAEADEADVDEEDGAGEMHFLEGLEEVEEESD